MAIKIKEMLIEERPRERLVKFGVNALSNEELLSIILKTGTKDKNVKELAHEILSKLNNISDLENITINKLIKINGIGTVKAIEIIAAIELGKRIFIKKTINQKEPLRNAKDIYLANQSLFYNSKQESFYCLYFDSKQRLIERKLLFMGTINKSIVHPREIFKEAYLLSASSIVCMHNHPSNNVKPSVEDIELTKALMEIGRIQQIPVLDHIIFGENEYYSFYENNSIINI
ncbi:MAG: DNA repair protein RadC [Tenericutes bacterium]|jgi:DNA repair protein RadC|nr:DNA repair protein RadC [Mycoplasmatota bacterium]